MIQILLLLVSLALVAACGVFVAAEFSFVTVDRSQVEQAADEGDARARGVRTALQSLSTQLSGAQVGITVTNLAIGFLAEPAIAELLRGPLTALGVPAGAVSGIAVLLGLVIATALTMVLGELVPKNLALAEPLGTARATQGFQRGFTSVMRWPIRMLNGSANWLVRRLGLEPQEELRSARTLEELSSLIGRSAEEGTLDSDTAALMARSVAFGERTAGEIMTPRVRMVDLDADDSVLSVIATAQQSGHSRFPVVSEDADDVVGAVHVKNAVAVPVAERATTPISAIMVPATVVPESLGLDPLMATLRQEGFQMAVVADEYGGTAGVVTLEDVVEEIVGEIADEHDRTGAKARRRRDGSWALSGLLRPDEVAELTGAALPEDDEYDTVAGLVLWHLGRLATVGDEVTVTLVVEPDPDGEPPPPGRAVLRVERLDGRRIDRIGMTVQQGRPADDAAHGGHDPGADTT